VSRSISFSEWVAGIESGEIPLKDKLIKKGLDVSYARTVLSEWHPTLNGTVTPNDVSATTDKVKVWWLCPEGHPYQARPSQRTRAGSGCGVCAGKTVLVGVNDMATTHPELVADWHPTKNGDLTPQDVLAGSDKKVWWKHADPSCMVPGGHEWQNYVKKRCLGGSGCPVCAPTKKKVIAGVNDMAMTHPELAADWHPTKNGDLTPQDVVAGSGTRFWWKHSDPACVVPGGHEWQVNGANRVSGTGCPACNKGWGLDAVRKFIITMVEYGHIGSLSQAELYTISEEADMNVHDLVNDMSDLDIAQADPEAFADFVLADVEGANFDDPEADDDMLVDSADMAAVMNGDAQAGAELSVNVLPGEAVEQALRTADVLFATVDEEMLEYFIAARLHALWQQAYKDPEAALAAAEKFRG
jgi:hypothetical protein